MEGDDLKDDEISQHILELEEELREVNESNCHLIDTLAGRVHREL